MIEQLNVCLQKDGNVSPASLLLFSASFPLIPSKLALMNRLKQSLGAALPTFGSTKDEERPTPPPISIDRVNLVQSHQQIITQIYASFTPFYRGVAKTRSNPLQEGLELRKGEQKQSSTWFGETMTNCAEEIDRLEGYGEVKDKYREPYPIRLLGARVVERADSS